MQTPFESLAYHRPRLPEARPHTSHASSSGINFIAEEEEQSDGDITPRASAASFGSREALDAARRRLSRDDTANDMHMLATHAASVQAASEAPAKAWSYPGTAANCFNAAAEDARAEQLRQRPRKAIPPRHSHSHVSPLPGEQPAPLTTIDPKSLTRRFSKGYREKLVGMRESMAKYSIPAFPAGRTRRSSTPHRLEETNIDLDLPSHWARPPTSPSKRSARDADNRPRKYRPTNLFPSSDRLSDRKDTPAPAFGLPVRPASSRQAPPGGEGARKAAAMHNNHTSPMNFAAVNWDLLEDDDIHDINSRRNRLGSLSSAADSGADLSTYSGSGASIRDCDGDINMSSSEDTSPATREQPRDFTQRLPTEIALQVFQHLEAQSLSRAEQVCKRWYYTIRDPSIWRTVFLRKYDRRTLGTNEDPAPIQVGGCGIGRPNRPNQEWRKMYKARVQLEENWRAGALDAGKAIYLSGHTDSVYCVQFDEEKIITGSRDRTIRVWDINTFQCLRVIGGPNVKPVLGPKVLRTVDYPSFHMATASVNGTAYGDSVYHVPTEWHDASILCLQYDDEILVTGSSDSDLLIWDIKTYQPIKRLKKHTGGVLDVALDANHIVSCSKDSRIIVWDRKTLEPKGDLTGHRGPVNAVQLRGNYLVSASGDGIARLWNLKQMRLIKEFSAKERGLAAVEFSEDQKYVLAGGNDNVTYKFEVETGMEVMQFNGHTQLVRSLWLDSANERVVSGSYDLDLRVYDFKTGQELWRGEEWTTSWMLAAKSDYRRIVATSQDGRILMVDFGIMKGAPTYASRDGMPIANVDCLRGTDNTNEIKFRNPFAPREKSISPLF